MNEVEEELRNVVAELAELDARRASLMVKRDRLMVRAMSEGMTWREVGEISGLSVGAVRKSVQRVRAD